MALRGVVKHHEQNKPAHPTQERGSGTSSLETETVASLRPELSDLVRPGGMGAGLVRNFSREGGLKNDPNAEEGFAEILKK